MQKAMIDRTCMEVPDGDEDLIDTLTAISIVAKRLAVNLRKEKMKEEGRNSGKNE